MVHVLEVTAEDINQLDEKKLTDLLLRLLSMEAQKYEIHKSCIHGSLEVKATDEGEDAHIKWSGGVEKTGWIPNCYTLFQCKAEDITPTECKNEILLKGKIEPCILKPRVKEVLDNGGSYVLFFTQKCNAKMKNDREKRIREGIQSTGASYYDNATIRIYDANSISIWVNEYIALIVQVCSWLGRYLPDSICTWEDWNKYSENDIGYVKDEVIEGHISQLINHFTEPKKIARIVGLSGLGKTRLALEVFRPPDNKKEEFKFQTISDQVVYIDAANDSIGLPGKIKQWREQKLEGILVVDNCELELHQRLTREIEHSDSRLSLLTLDYNPESSNDICIVKLKRASSNVIKGIITQSYSTLTDPDISRIVEFADGFPKIAVMLAEARLHEVPDIGNLTDDVLRDKLLWGRGHENETSRKVIGACSLFTHLGFCDDMANQRCFVAEKICNISDADFYSCAADFIHRGILDRRNRFVRVVPIPLAVRLAADWWKKCSSERAKELITGDMPDGMAEALCDQIRKLHYVHEARKLTEELCGDSAPFGQAGVLNSEKGSRLFRSLVEVNPQATVEALDRAFGDYTKEQLLEVGPGRRNLIGALENLCFWEETFPIASRIMLSFAVSENETWGNNATNQFLQLFHYTLSGTQAPPKARLEVIDEALSSDDNEYKVLAVKALGHSLMSHHFCRRLGVECQGSRLPQEEWRPKLWSDVFDYWRGSLKRLIPLCCEYSELAKLARKQISENIRSLVQYGLMDEIEAALTKICKESNIFWPEIYNEIEESIVYEGPNIPSEGLIRLKSWLEILKPLSLSGRLKLIVSTPPQAFEKNENGNYVNLYYDKSVSLAKECSGDIAQLIKYLNILFEGEQINGFIFGYTLGENLTAPKGFIENSLHTMKKVDPTEVNPVVLGGFLSAIKPDFPELVEETLDDISQDEVLHVHTVYLTRCIVPDQKDLNRIVKLIKMGKIKVNDLRMLGVSHQPPKTVLSFCNELIKFGHEGLLAALEILFHYTVNKPDKLEICKEEIRKILLTPGVISNYDRHSLMDDYYLSESMEIFLFKEDEDLDLASHISNEIIGLCSKDVNIYLFKSFLEPIIQGLLLRYRDTTWPIFGAGLLSENVTLNYKIMGLFDSLNNSENSNKSVLSEISPEFLIEWCKKEPNKAPLLIAKMMPIFTKNIEAWSLHPLAKSLVDNYGDRPDVLLEIDRNLGTFFWSESVISYYEKQIEVMAQLLDHKIPNVHKWAKKNIAYLKKQIEEEMKKQEEEDLGIF